MTTSSTGSISFNLAPENKEQIIERLLRNNTITFNEMMVLLDVKKYTHADSPYFGGIDPWDNSRTVFGTAPKTDTVPYFQGVSNINGNDKD